MYNIINQMKLHSFAAEILFFSLIFLGFAVPPFFHLAASVPEGVFSEWTFPLTQLVLAVAALGIYLIFREKTERSLIFFPVIFTVSLLFCLALILKFVSSLHFFAHKPAFEVARPSTIIQWIFCLLNFLLAAFYEEIIYRFYLPDALLRIISRKSGSRARLYLCEIFAGALFAAGHFYLGALAVVNAAGAHVVLRRCYKITGTIWCGVCAHFIYNVISLILL